MSTYVVTGAASGIGSATRGRLERDGHRVIGVDLRDAEVTGDLGDPAARAAIAAETLAAAPEGLAGVVPCAGLAGLTGSDARQLVSVNYFGAVQLLAALRPALGPGAAVVLLSSNSVTCQPGWPTGLADACLAGDEAAARDLAATHQAVQVYPATKAALAWWARREGISAPWAGAGIRVNAVAPGLIATPMTERLRADPELGVFADAYPSVLDRAGRPEEIAELIAFLLSDQAGLIVGSVVFADGGTDAMLHPEQPRPR